LAEFGLRELGPATGMVIGAGAAIVTARAVQATEAALVRVSVIARRASDARCRRVRVMSARSESKRI